MMIKPGFTFDSSLITQAIVGLFLYLLAFRAITALVNWSARKAWKDLVLHLLLFTLLLISFAFFTLPDLEDLKLIGTVFAALTLTAVTATLQQRISRGENLAEEVFGPDGPKLLKAFPPNPSTNLRGLTRIYHVLKTRDDILAEEVRTNVTVSQCPASPDFWMFDVISHITYEKVDNLPEFRLVYEVVPTWQPETPYQMSFPFNHQKETPVGFWPPFGSDQFGFWSTWLEKIHVQAWTHSPSGRHEIPFNNREEIRIEYKTDTPPGGHIITNKIRFTSKETVKLDADFPELEVHVNRIPHPKHTPSLYIHLSEICRGSWSYRVSLDDTTLPLKILSLTPITSLNGDIVVRSISNYGNLALVEMRANEGSLFLPQDAVLTRFVNSDSLPAFHESSMLMQQTADGAADQ